MLLVFGPHHPRTPDEDVPLDPARKALAVFAVIMFILCFTPAPIEPMDIVTQRFVGESSGTFRPPTTQCTDDVDDAGLIALARRGDAVAFSRLFAGFERPIFRYAAHMCGRDAADDVVQDTFLARPSWARQLRPDQGQRRQLPVRDRAAFRAEAAEWHARSRASSSTEDDESAGVGGARRPSVLDSLSREETIRAVRAAIASLPAPYREVVVLCELQETSYADAATIVQCPSAPCGPGCTARERC